MIIAVLQARTGSSRLPVKVLADVLGKPMITRQIERIARARLVDRLVIATTGQREDDAIAALAAELRIDCYRGSVDDVLDRFYQCAKRYDADHIVRLTADCPLADPQLIDDLIRLHLREGNNYSSNAMPPTFPHGLDAEIMTRKALVWVWENATKADEREHVTTYIRNNPSRFRIGNLEQKNDLSHLRWTVDEPEDLDVIRRIYEELYIANPGFTTQDILDFVDIHPEIAAINAHFSRDPSINTKRF